MTNDFPRLEAGGRAPERPVARAVWSRLAVRLMTLGIRAYQLTISPAQVFLFGPGAGCRYTPSCSVYAAEAVRAHGAVAGSALAARRICRCHPWGGSGPDPVPPAVRQAKAA
jgi:hypothetical protein